MAIALAQAAIGNATADDGTGSTASVAQAFGSNVTAGNLLVVFIAAWNSSGDFLFQISDTQGCNWIQLFDSSAIRSFDSGIGNVSMFFAIAKSSAACTVTVTFNNAAGAGFAALPREATLQVREYSGVDQVVPFDNCRFTTPTGTAPSMNITVEVANSLVVGMFAMGSTNTPTAGTNFTNGRTDPSNGDANTHFPVFVEDRVVSPSGTVAVACSAANGGQFAILAASFRPAGTYTSKPYVVQQQVKSNYDNTPLGSVAITVKGVRAGSTLVCVIAGLTAASNPTSVQDQSSNNFTATPNSPATNTTGKLWIYYRISVAGGDTTITATWAVSRTYYDIRVLEVTNIGAFDTDAAVTTAQSGTTMTLPSLTTNFANDFVVFGGDTNNDVSSAGSSYAQGNGCQNSGEMSEWLLGASIGTYTPGMVVGPSGNWVAIGAAFKYQSSGVSDIITEQLNYSMKIQ